MWDTYMSYYGSMILLIPAILFTFYAQAKVFQSQKQPESDRSAGS